MVKKNYKYKEEEKMLYEGKKKRKVNRKDGKEKNKKMKEAN